MDRRAFLSALLAPFAPSPERPERPTCTTYVHQPYTLGFTYLTDPEEAWSISDFRGVFGTTDA